MVVPGDFRAISSPKVSTPSWLIVSRPRTSTWTGTSLAGAGVAVAVTSISGRLNVSSRSSAARPRQGKTMTTASAASTQRIKRPPASLKKRRARGNTDTTPHQSDGVLSMGRLCLEARHDFSQAGLPAQGSSYLPRLPIRAFARTVAVCGFRPLSRLRASAGFAPDFPLSRIADADLRVQ